MGIVVTDRTATRSPATETIRAALRMAHSHDLSKRSVLLGLWQTTVSTILEAAASRADACRVLVRHAQAIKGEGSNADSPILSMDTPTARRRVTEATEATKLIGACLDVYLENLTDEGRRDEFPSLIASSAFEILSDIWGPRHLRKAIAAQVQQIDSGADSPILPDEPVTTNVTSPGLPAPPPSARAPETRDDRGSVPFHPTEGRPTDGDAPPPPMEPEEGEPDDEPPPPPMGDDEEDSPAFEDEAFSAHAGDEEADATFAPLDTDAEDALASLLALSGDAHGTENAHATERAEAALAPGRPGHGQDGSGHTEASEDTEEVDVVGENTDTDEVGEDELLGLLDIPEPPPVPVLEDDLDDLPVPTARKEGEAFRPFMTLDELNQDGTEQAGEHAGWETPTHPEADPVGMPPRNDGPPPPAPPVVSAGILTSLLDDPDPPTEPKTGTTADLDAFPESPPPGATKAAAPEPARIAEAAPARPPAAIEMGQPSPVPDLNADMPREADTPAPAASESLPEARPLPQGLRERLAASHRGRRLECCMLVADDELGKDGIFAAVATITSADGLVGETRELSGRMGGVTGRRAILTACRETLARLGDPAPGERLRFTVDSDLVFQGATKPDQRSGTAAEREIWNDIDALCVGRVVDWTKRRPGLGSGPGERCDRMIRATMAG